MPSTGATSMLYERHVHRMACKQRLQMRPRSAGSLTGYGKQASKSLRGGSCECTRVCGSSCGAEAPMDSCQQRARASAPRRATPPHPAAARPLRAICYHMLLSCDPTRRCWHTASQPREQHSQPSGASPAAMSRPLQQRLAEQQPVLMRHQNCCQPLPPLLQYPVAAHPE